MLSEVAPYGAALPDNIWSDHGGTCSMLYRTSAPVAEILVYYEQQLPQHGWRVVGWSGPHDRPRFLIARRERFEYMMSVSDGANQETPTEGVTVVTQVTDVP